MNKRLSPLISFLLSIFVGRKTGANWIWPRTLVERGASLPARDRFSAPRWPAAEMLAAGKPERATSSPARVPRVGTRRDAARTVDRSTRYTTQAFRCLGASVTAGGNWWGHRGSGWRRGGVVGEDRAAGGGPTGGHGRLQGSTVRQLAPRGARNPDDRHGVDESTSTQEMERPRPEGFVRRCGGRTDGNAPAAVDSREPRPRNNIYAVFAVPSRRVAHTEPPGQGRSWKGVLFRPGRRGGGDVAHTWKNGVGFIEAAGGSKRSRRPGRHERVICGGFCRGRRTRGIADRRRCTRAVAIQAPLCVFVGHRACCVRHRNNEAEAGGRNTFRRQSEIDLVATVKAGD